MEEEKIKVPVYEGMAKILDVVNGIYFAKLMGVSKSWISSKQSNIVNPRGYKASYSVQDVSLINEHLPRLAGCIYRECMIPADLFADSDAISNHLVQYVKPIISMKHLVEKRMGKSFNWLRTRIDTGDSSTRKTCKFKPEDAREINRQFAEIILYIRGIEMEYEPPVN